MLRYVAHGGESMGPAPPTEPQPAALGDGVTSQDMPGQQHIEAALHSRTGRALDSYPAVINQLLGRIDM
jgi:hypothetical protein